MRTSQVTVFFLKAVYSFNGYIAFDNNHAELKVTGDFRTLDESEAF